ncbi:MAG: hypothetical protein QM749_06155 [Aquabacterium sp.]
MRTLQTQEVKVVSGAGLITGVLTTGAQAGAAVGKGLLQAGVIVGKPPGDRHRERAQVHHLIQVASSTASVLG